jgi:hypothetical protein
MERRQVDLGLSEILDRVRLSERHRGPRVSRAAAAERSRERAAGSVRGRGKRPGRRERAAKKGRR